MIFSMTGFARVQQTLDDKTITVEIRAVNNRYLDCNLHTSRTYGFLEDPIKAAAAKKVSRGKLDIFIGIELPQGEQLDAALNVPLLLALKQGFAQMDEYGIVNDIKASDLVGLPNIFTITKKEQDRDVLQAEVMSVLDAALDDFNAARAAEGSRLTVAIRERAAVIAELRGSIEIRMPDIVAEYRAKLATRMTEILQDKSVDESRLLTEAALFADRISTDEELVRLDSHLIQLDEILNKGGTVGRKLDFLVQEINREINTIGSKTGDVTATRIVVDMKSELEKIREQIQNLE